MKVSALPQGLNRLGAQPPRASPRERASEKNLSENSAYPLISLDSDERIQGNPRKSNRRIRGFSQRKRLVSRKAKRRSSGISSPGADPSPAVRTGRSSP